MRAFALLVVFVAACLSCTAKTPPKAPESSLPQGLRYDVIPGEKANQRLLEAMVQRRVTKVHGDVMHVETTVWWVDGIIMYRGGRKGGLHFSCDEIYVSDYPLCNSSFVHELIHCYRETLTGDPDGDHADKAWWDLVDPLKEKCRERGFDQADSIL